MTWSKLTFFYVAPEYHIWYSIPDFKKMYLKNVKALLFHKIKNICKKTILLNWNTNCFTIFVLRNFRRKGHSKLSQPCKWGLKGFVVLYIHYTVGLALIFIYFRLIGIYLQLVALLGLCFLLYIWICRHIGLKRFVCFCRICHGTPWYHHVCSHCLGHLASCHHY